MQMSSCPLLIDILSVLGGQLFLNSLLAYKNRDESTFCRLRSGIAPCIYAR